ncbi:MAG: hypothetical protein R3C53_27175 [Pirellulaceae bacterium]
MTLLGKVFTGLVFLLSVLFFAFSIAVTATHINWKDKATAAQAAAQTSQGKNEQLTQSLEELKTELAIEQSARRMALASLQTQLGQTLEDLRTQEAELAQLQSAHTTVVQTENATQIELKSRTAENELLRQQIKDARLDRDQIFQRLVNAKDEFNRLQGDLDTLIERERALATAYTAAKEKLDILGITPATLLEAPAANGEVLAVATNGLVEISLGRDDGMKEGFTLEVHRSGQYLGKLRVRTVRDDKSVAEILTGFQKGYIRAGDRVDTKLY